MDNRLHRRQDFGKQRLERNFVNSSLELMEHSSYNQWRLRSEECIDRLIGEINLLRSELQTLYDRYQDERAIWRRAQTDMEDRIEALTASIEAEEDALAEASKQYRARFAHLMLENRELKVELGREPGFIENGPSVYVEDSDKHSRDVISLRSDQATIGSVPPVTTTPAASTEVVQPKQEEGGALGFFKGLTNKFSGNESSSRAASPTHADNSNPEIQKKNEEIEKLKSKLKDVETKLETKLKEHREVTDSLKKVETELVSFKSKSDEVSKGRSDVQQQLDTSSEELKKAKAELELLNKEKSRQKATISESEANLQKQKELVEQKTKDIENLKEELKTTKKMLTEESEKTLTEKTQAYELKLKELDEEVQKHRIRQKDTDKKLTNLRHKVKEKKYTEESLMKDLDELIQLQATNIELNFFTKLFS